MEGVRVIGVRVDLLDAYAVSGDDALILIKSMISHGKNDQEVRAILFDWWYRTKITGQAIILKRSKLFGEKCPLLERLKTEGDLWGTNNVREWILKVSQRQFRIHEI
jgi:hypothetical protein